MNQSIFPGDPEEVTGKQEKQQELLALLLHQVHPHCGLWEISAKDTFDLKMFIVQNKAQM